MGEASSNSPMRGIRGKLGKVAVFREYNGRTLACNYPKRSTKVSEGQSVIRERFLDAIHYAKEQVKDPVANAMYKEGISTSKRSVYAVAMSDYLQKPKIQSIDATVYTGAIGENIVIKAKDDFKVNKVMVLIQGSTGTTLESGEAIIDPKQRAQFLYTTTVVNGTLPGSTIRVIASDFAGNNAEQALTLS